jgi:hypothetical protein
VGIIVFLLGTDSNREKREEGEELICYVLTSVCVYCLFVLCMRCREDWQQEEEELFAALQDEKGSLILERPVCADPSHFTQQRTITLSYTILGS